VRTHSLTLWGGGCTVERHVERSRRRIYDADLFAISRSPEPEAAHHTTSSAPFSDNSPRGCRTTLCRVRLQRAAGLVRDQIPSLTVALNRDLWR
jgi:hypothetical protein